MQSATAMLAEPEMTLTGFLRNPEAPTGQKLAELSHCVSVATTHTNVDPNPNTRGRYRLMPHERVNGAVSAIVGFEPCKQNHIHRSYIVG
jgi:hypothetical protein